MSDSNRSGYRDEALGSVRDHYETFPFPPVDFILEEDICRDLSAAFTYEMGLGRDRTLRSDADVWVPGCGTRWAVMLALQFKNARIVASDLSEASIHRQQTLAASLGITNIEWRCEDLLSSSAYEQFDFISCVGVLHHLRDPFEGFSTLRRALRPTGIIEIMVYDALNRHQSKRMCDVLAILDPEQTTCASERFALALRLLQALNEKANVPAELDRVLRYAKSRPGFKRDLADFISNPKENYFEVPSLMAMLRGAGLRLRSWKMPHRFDPATMICDDALASTFNRLDPIARAHLGQLMSAGLLELYVERTDAPAKELRESDDGTLVLASPTGVEYKIDEDGSMLSKKTYSKMQKTGGTLLFDGGERRPAVLAYSPDLDCILPGPRQLERLKQPYSFIDGMHELIDLIMAHARTPVALADLAADVARATPGIPGGASSILTLCRELSRTPSRVLLALP